MADTWEHTSTRSLDIRGDPPSVAGMADPVPAAGSWTIDAGQSYEITFQLGAYSSNGQSAPINAQHFTVEEVAVTINGTEVGTFSGSQGDDGITHQATVTVPISGTVTADGSGQFEVGVTASGGITDSAEGLAYDDIPTGGLVRLWNDENNPSGVSATTTVIDAGVMVGGFSPFTGVLLAIDSAYTYAISSWDIALTWDCATGGFIFSQDLEYQINGGGYSFIVEDNDLPTGTFDVSPLGPTDQVQFAGYPAHETADEAEAVLEHAYVDFHATYAGALGAAEVVTVTRETGIELTDSPGDFGSWDVRMTPS